jgi:gamma-glutamylcysteine synthetase
MSSLAKTVSARWNTTSIAVDVADGLLSFITPIQNQVDEFAAAVKALALAHNITTDGIHGALNL